jgi:hypothetical protein
LIVAHEVTNSGSDRSQLANMALRAKDVLGAEHVDAIVDRDYFNSLEISRMRAGQYYCDAAEYQPRAVAA